MDIYQKYFWDEVHGKIRVPGTKAVTLRYPSPSMAQLANTSTEGFEDLYFKVCNLDYAKMSGAMDPLVGSHDQDRPVRIVGTAPISRSPIKGSPAIKCDGRHNIPDGEVYTAPVRIL